jgi:hypothetical protein
VHRLIADLFVDWFAVLGEVCPIANLVKNDNSNNGLDIVANISKLLIPTSTPRPYATNSSVADLHARSHTKGLSSQEQLFECKANTGTSTTASYIMNDEATSKWSPTNLTAFEESNLKSTWMDYTDKHRPGWISNLASLSNTDTTTVGGPELVFPLGDRLTGGMNSSKSGAIGLHIEYLKTYFGAGEADITVCGGESVGTIVAISSIDENGNYLNGGTTRNPLNHVSIPQFFSYMLTAADAERCSALLPSEQSVSIRVMNRWVNKKDLEMAVKVQQNRKVKIFRVWMCFVD